MGNAYRFVLAFSGLILLLVSSSGCTSPEIQESADFLSGLFFREAPLPSGDTIRIATWNIENFGKTKATDPSRISRIAEVLARYDIAAVQEISNVREFPEPGCPRNEPYCPGHPNCGLVRKSLESEFEKLGVNRTLVFSPQVRDERYLFVFDPGKARLLEHGLMIDPEDSEPICSLSQENTGLMLRQPFAGVFLSQDFDFLILTAHTSPGINIRELEGLEKFFQEALEMGEEDVILLGDLNADCDYLGKYDSVALRNSKYLWPVPDEADTTSGSSDCAYDRFVFTENTREDYSGSWGVDKDIPGNVSDHYPVWVDFFVERDSD